MLVVATGLVFAVDEVAISKIFHLSARLGYEPSSDELRQLKSRIELCPLTLCLSEYQLITFTPSLTATYKLAHNIVKLPFYNYILEFRSTSLKLENKK